MVIRDVLSSCQHSGCGIALSFYKMSPLEEAGSLCIFSSCIISTTCDTFSVVLSE